MNVSITEEASFIPLAFRFQEIVPLNAGNVLGTENNGPARKWLALIRKTLNSLPGTSGGCHTPSPTPDPVVELDADFEGSTRPKASSFFHRRSFQSLSRSMRMDNEMALSQPQLDRRFSVCDRVIFGHRPSDYDPNFRWGSSDDENGPGDSPVNTHYSPVTYSGSLFTEDRDRPCGPSRYCLVASKQMVGIFLTVWVKSDLRDSVHNMKVSCVGRGLMGYLGNKVYFCFCKNFLHFDSEAMVNIIYLFIYSYIYFYTEPFLVYLIFQGSISISMSLHQTSFCFICSHLTSGQKEGDELRRNSDVMEIIRKTRFPKVHGIGDENSPQTILEHEYGPYPLALIILLINSAFGAFSLNFVNKKQFKTNLLLAYHCSLFKVLLMLVQSNHLAWRFKLSDSSVIPLCKGSC